jgi:hypothetical protein
MFKKNQRNTPPYFITFHAYIMHICTTHYNYKIASVLFWILPSCTANPEHSTRHAPAI